ncbi:hypothetical protein [Luteibacter sp.]|uniref:hypothetical protein n=1 Tax=Luteibacter sp. TaxID=1886636 RepID=UPI003F7ECBD4
MCDDTSLKQTKTGEKPTKICYADELFPVDLKPTIPAALADGTLTPESMRPHLLVHAPIISVDGYHTMPGDFFEALIDGILIPASRATYSGEGDFVEIRIPQVDFLTRSAGRHELTYLAIQQPFGSIAISEPTTYLIDRTPPGGRGLPRIMFAEADERDGLALEDIKARPSMGLRGKIADYAGIDPRDTIQLFSKFDGSDTEFAAGTIEVGQKAWITEVYFGHDNFTNIDAPGRISFYYYVVDVSGNKSHVSPETTLRVY